MSSNTPSFAGTEAPRRPYVNFKYEKESGKEKFWFTINTAPDVEFTFVEGDIIDAMEKSIVAKDTGKTHLYQTFIMRAADGTVFELTASKGKGYWRTMLNALSNLIEGGDFSGIIVRLYVNTKGYPGVAIEQNGQKVDWRFAIADLPEAPKVQRVSDPDTTDIDYRAQNAFFADIFTNSLQPAIKAYGESTRAKTPANPAPEQREAEKGDDIVAAARADMAERAAKAEPAEEYEDDLPF